MAHLLLQHIDLKGEVPSSKDYDALMITAATCVFTDIIRWALKKKPDQYNHETKGKRQFIKTSGCSLLSTIDLDHKDIVAALMDYGAEAYGDVLASSHFQGS